MLIASTQIGGNMKKQRLQAVALSTMLSAGALMGSVAQADQTLNSILQVGQANTAQAQKSQQRINKLQESTDTLLQEFKQVNKENEGLRVYNAQLEQQIEKQTVVLTELQESIDGATVIKRQFKPLMLRMLDGIEQFITLDLPIELNHRLDQLETVRDNFERADIGDAEKFRQVLDLYKIEAEYGRKLQTYKDSLPVGDGGAEREVNVLQVGRVALVFQTTDTKLTGVYNKSTGQWEELDAGEYRAAVSKGIRIAKKQASIDILKLPVPAPEAAQ